MKYQKEVTTEYSIYDEDHISKTKQFCDEKRAMLNIPKHTFLSNRFVKNNVEGK